MHLGLPAMNERNAGRLLNREQLRTDVHNNG
jgi:hypothetical protein